MVVVVLPFLLLPPSMVRGLGGSIRSNCARRHNPRSPHDVLYLPIKFAKSAHDVSAPAESGILSPKIFAQVVDWDWVVRTEKKWPLGDAAGGSDSTT